MKITIGADHGGFSLKEEIVEYLKKKEEIEIEDVGTHEGPTKRVDYPDIAMAVCARVAKGEAERGILICGTGIGISIAANKVEGIRCALCHDHFTAMLSRQHNDANVVAFGGRNTGPEVAKEIVDTFLVTCFQGQHHIPRLEKISSIEKLGHC